MGGWEGGREGGEGGGQRSYSWEVKAAAGDVAARVVVVDAERGVACVTRSRLRTTTCPSASTAPNSAVVLPASFPACAEEGDAPNFSGRTSGTMDDDLHVGTGAR